MRVSVVSFTLHLRNSSVVGGENLAKWAEWRPRSGLAGGHLPAPVRASQDPRPYRFSWTRRKTRDVSEVVGFQMLLSFVKSHPEDANDLDVIGMRKHVEGLDAFEVEASQNQVDGVACERRWIAGNIVDGP